MNVALRALTYNTPLMMAASGRAWLAVLLAIVATAVGVHYTQRHFWPTSIGSIQANPGAYLNASIAVRGEANAAIGVAGYGGYVLRDKSGSIAVISKNSTPKSGTTVYIRGRVQQLVVISDVGLVAFIAD
jgi:hypothetical protein